MTRPRLLYITDAEDLGGAESYLQTLLCHADQSRYEVGVLLPPRLATQPLVEAARSCGVAVHFLDLPHQNGLHPTAIWQAWRVFRRIRPTIAHFVLASPRRCAEMIVAAALAQVPRRVVTFQLVTPVPQFGWLMGRLRGLNRWLQYRTLHYGIAVSQGNAQLLRDQYRFSAQLVTIPNAVDPTRWNVTRSGELRRRWDISTEVLVLGMVGRLNYQKGHRTLFAALPQVWEQHPNTHVVLMGRGNLEAELRAEAALIDSEQRIHFVGQQTDMPQALAELDVFVLPSLYEGMSFAVLEAMAAGQAIVASNVDGTREALTNFHSGLLVPPNNAQHLVLALVQVLGDAALRERMGQAAREVVVRDFNEATMLAQTFALYG